MHLKPKIIEAIAEKVDAVNAERAVILEGLGNLLSSIATMRVLVGDGINLTVAGGDIPEMKELEATDLESAVIAIGERLKKLRTLIKEYEEF